MDPRRRVLDGLLPPNAMEIPHSEKRHHSKASAEHCPTTASAAYRLREVTVTGTAESCSPADRASVRVGVGSSGKDSANEASNSVSRRVGYILQTLRQHGLKDQDTTVRRCLLRDGDQYRMDAEVLMTFSDFETMEKVCCVLLEKLDKSVSVGMPQYYHSAECLGDVRHRAFVLAVENAQRKAKEVSEFLDQALGPPLLVREEETREWRSDEEEDSSRKNPVAQLPRLWCIPTVSASSRVSVSFSLRDGSRKNL